MTQSGGTNTVTGVFSIGALGMYNLTGGALIVPGIQGTGVFNLGGGTLVASSGFSSSQAMMLTGSGGNGNINPGGDPVTLTGVLSGPGGLNVLGDGILTLTASEAYTGGTTISAGTLLIGSGGTTGSLVGNIADNSALVFDRSDNPTFAGAISGSGSLTQAGLGMLTLSASNTFSGATTISAGSISLNNVSAVQNSTVTVNTNNSLRFNTNNGAIATFNLGGLAGSGNISLADSSHAVTLNVGGNGTSSTYSGGLSGSGGLIKTGGGALDLCGGNTYTGSTSVTAGALLVDFSQAGAPTANIINNTTNTSPLLLGGSTLAIQGNFSTSNSQRFNGLTVNPGCSAIVLTAGASNSLLLSLGTISRSAGGTVDFTLPSGTLSGSNGVTTTTPNTAAGILGAYATVSGVNWAVSGGSASSITPYSAYTSGDLGAIGSGALLNVSPSGSQSNVTSAAQFNTLNLAGTEGVTMAGSGSLTLLGGGLIGNTSGTIAGGALAGSSSGELIVITPQNLTIGSVIADNGGPTALTKAGPAMLTLAGSNTYSGATTVGAGALQIGNGGSGEFLASPSVSLSNSASLVFNHADALTYSGLIGGSGNLTQTGSGLLTLTGINTYTGGTTISAGTLQLGNGNAAASVGPGTVTDNSALVVNLPGAQTFGGTINGAGSLTQAGTGLLTLTGSNSYTGGTTISAGTLQVGNAAAAVGPGTLIDNSSLVLTFSGPQTFNGMISGIGAMTQAGGGMLTLTASNTYTGGTTVSSGTLQVGNGGSGEYLASSSVSLGNSAALVFNNSDALTYNGAVSGSGSLTLAGTGLATLAGSNTYTGGTTISAGTLQVGNGNAAAALGPGTLTNNGALVFDFAGIQTFGGAISGVGSLTQAGMGMLTLTASNTYSGSTMISAGTLQVGNGNATATFGTGPLTDNSALVFSLSGAQTYGGTINGSGSLTQAGAGMLTLTGSNPYTGGTTISAGTLQLGNGGSGASIGSTSSILDSGSLVFNHADSVTFSPAISGNGSLTQTGTGTLTLMGSNNSIGSMTIAGGMLQVGNGGSLNVSGGPTLVNSSGTLLASVGVFTAGGDVTVNGGNLLVNGAFTLGGGHTLTVENSGVADFAQGPFFLDQGTTLHVASGGTLQDVSQLAVAFSGFGKAALTVDGVNTSVTAGALLVGGGGASGSATFSGSSTSTFSYIGIAADSFPGTNGTLSITSGASVLLAGALDLSDVGGGATGSIILSGSGSQLTQSSGSSPITLGSRAFGSANFTVGSGAVFTAAGPLTVNGPAVLTVSGSVSAAAVTNNGSIVLSGGTLQTSGSFANNLDGSISGSGDLIAGCTWLAGQAPAGPGIYDCGVSLILSGSNTYTGGTYVESGTLIVAAGDAIPVGTSVCVGASGTLIFDSAAAAGLVQASPAEAASGKVAAVPEPGTMALLLAAFWSSAAIYRRFRQRGVQRAGRLDRSA